jgi:hypothetical protein
MAGPKTAILHSVRESAAEDLAATVRERVPDVDLAVARTPRSPRTRLRTPRWC